VILASRPLDDLDQRLGGAAYEELSLQPLPSVPAGKFSTSLRRFAKMDPVWSSVLETKKTNSVAFLDRLVRTEPAHIKSDSVLRFFELDHSSTRHADPAMISADQIRAWITTAFGDLLSSIAFTPIEDDQGRKLVIKEVMKRISNITSASYEAFTDYGCAILYTTYITQDGLQRTAFVRQGQGSDWMHHWNWLSAPQDARAMKATLQLAGQLLINSPVLIGLTSTIRNGDENSQRRALCVTRRWLLTAKVLAWMFEALQHNWTSVRPQDLACFAFSALSPAWPRRAVAVSHRSADAKPVLSALRMWKSPHVAIDASYVPAWETNIGMIWSLFASVPLIVRVKSPAYFESEWCKREHEMLQYLVEHGDFLEGRAIIDINADQLAELDVSLFEDTTARSEASLMKPFSAPKKEFPPSSLVLVGHVPLAIDLSILRAAGALRIINALVRNPAMANEVASRAAAGDKIDIEAPTNNPDGWTAYGEIFRNLEWLLMNKDDPKALLEDTSAKCSVGEKLEGRSSKTSLSLRVPADYSALDVERDRANAQEIPDLSGGEYRLDDVLAALEWRRTVFAWFLEEGFGDKVIVDVRRTNAKEWGRLSIMSVGRGLLALNGFSPTWIMQRAGQNAHLWSGFREQPIFTCHVDEQFKWLKPVFLDPCWLVYYLANSSLSVESNLQAAMIAAVVHSGGPEAVKLERRAEGVSVIVPTPRSFFTIPKDAFKDVFDLMDSTEKRRE
jgi:hypothetical protein